MRSTRPRSSNQYLSDKIKTFIMTVTLLNRYKTYVYFRPDTTISIVSRYKVRNMLCFKAGLMMAAWAAETCSHTWFNFISAYYWNCCVWRKIYIRFILSHNGMASIKFINRDSSVNVVTTFCTGRPGFRLPSVEPYSLLYNEGWGCSESPGVQSAKLTSVWG